MRRVMVVGGPGSGKTMLAVELGRRRHLPVRHMDLIHCRPGWIGRGRDEKDRLTRAVHAEHAWIFEGGHSRTYDERAARADTLIWLDLAVRTPCASGGSRVAGGHGAAGRAPTCRPAARSGSIPSPSASSCEPVGAHRRGSHG